MSRHQVHYCISGFTQHQGRNNGVLKLSELLINAGFADGSRSRVYLHPWKAQWQTIAEHAFLLGSLYDRQLVVGIYAYSWGAGHGAIRLASELGERGIAVEQMVLCDPVPRPWLPWRWTAMLPASLGRSIKVPGNVRMVRSLNQRKNLPQGHDVVARSDKTVVVPPFRLYCTHQYADDATRFHNVALTAAREVAQSAGHRDGN